MIAVEYERVYANGLKVPHFPGAWVVRGCLNGRANAWWKGVFGSFLCSQSGYVKSQQNFKTSSLIMSITMCIETWSSLELTNEASLV